MKLGSSRRARSGRFWAILLSGGLSLGSFACGSVTDGSPSASDSDFTQEMSEIAFGTESGNPSEVPEDLGTESGNPTAPEPAMAAEPEPLSELGTESGNPTRPSPVLPVGVPEPAVPVSEPVGGAAEPTPDGSPEPMTELPTPDGISPEPVDTPMPTSTMPDGMPSQPPGSAAGNACDLATCQSHAEAAAQGFAVVLAEPAPFESRTCVAPGTCECTSASRTVTLTASAEDECLVPGRLACLVPASAFAGCDPGEANGCEVACGEVHEALATDALGFAVEVRASSCTPSGCRYILVSGGQCYLSGDGLSTEPVDCTVSDEQLLGSR